MNLLTYFFLNKNNIGFNFDGVPEYDYDALALLKKDENLSFTGVDTKEKDVTVVRGKHEMVTSTEVNIDKAGQHVLNNLQKEIDVENEKLAELKGIIEGINLTDAEKGALNLVGVSEFKKSYEKRKLHIEELITQLHKHQSVVTNSSKWNLQKIDYQIKSSPNKLIIGENMDVLRNLVSIKNVGMTNKKDFSYDVIYIDPPYNTESTLKDGNKAADHLEDVQNNTFIYRDKFARNGWLSLMRDRLKLAHKLLNENGMIFVSIDDNEQAYLKVLMDQIFGENNFIASFVWQKKNDGASTQVKHIKVLHEYILFYAKNKDQVQISKEKININDSKYKYEDEYVATRGKYYLRRLDDSSLFYTPKSDYEFTYEGVTYYPGGSKNKFLERQNGIHGQTDWMWRSTPEKLEKAIKDGFIIFKDGKIYRKQYQYVDFEDNEINRSSAYGSIILNKYGGQGTQMLQSIFGTKIFNYPKPVDLIKHLINLHPNKNAKVLDFFAGSGTTGHAVLELNCEDRGNRTFTLVTNNENGIGENITYERLYRINKGVGTKGESFPWIAKNEAFKSGLDVFWTFYYDTDILQLNRELNSDVKKISLNDLVDVLEETYLNFGIEQKYELLNNLKEIGVSDLVDGATDQVLKLKHTQNPMEIRQEVILSEFYRFYLNQLKTLKPLKLNNSIKVNKRKIGYNDGKQW